MKTLIRSILGAYIPLYDSTGPITGLAGLDWEWIIGAELFCILVYCLLRCFSALLTRK